MNPRHLRMRKLKMVSVGLSPEVRRMYAPGGLPFETKPDDPRALTLLRAGEAVERQMKPNGVTW